MLTLFKFYDSVIVNKNIILVRMLWFFLLSDTINIFRLLFSSRNLNKLKKTNEKSTHLDKKYGFVTTIVTYDAHSFLFKRKGVLTIARLFNLNK